MNLGARRVKKFPLPDIPLLVTEIKDSEKDLWRERPYGDQWADIPLIGGKSDYDKENAKLPQVSKYLNSLPQRPIGASLAVLGPGGFIKEHRDFAGGSPLGVLRIHIPLITNNKVMFFIDRKPLIMSVGEIWTLDTTYLHSVKNDSDFARIHLIIDLKASFYKNLVAFNKLPFWPVLLHKIYFFSLLFKRSFWMLIKSGPRIYIKYLKKFANLIFNAKSPLY